MPTAGSCGGSPSAFVCVLVRLAGMCGRFAASASTEDLIDLFGIEEVADPAMASYNLAPTDPIPAVLDRLVADADAPMRTLVSPRWGLIPSWVKDPSGAARLINARAETIATKRSFSGSLSRRRCLIPADGYYEWTPKVESGRTVKQPWFLHPREGLFVMAGLYAWWREPGTGAWLLTATIITTQASDALGHIHDRMPMTVAPADWDAWLDPRLTESQCALPLLATPEDMSVHAVSRAVNRVANNGPELVLPVEDVPAT